MKSKKNNKNQKSKGNDRKLHGAERFISFLAEQERQWYSVNYLLAKAHRRGRTPKKVVIHSVPHDNADFYPAQYYKNISTMWKLKTAKGYDARKK